MKDDNVWGKISRCQWSCCNHKQDQTFNHKWSNHKGSWVDLIISTPWVQSLCGRPQSCCNRPTFIARPNQHRLPHEVPPYIERPQPCQTAVVSNIKQSCVLGGLGVCFTRSVSPVRLPNHCFMSSREGKRERGVTPECYSNDVPDTVTETFPFSTKHLVTNVCITKLQSLIQHTLRAAPSAPFHSQNGHIWHLFVFFSAFPIVKECTPFQDLLLVWPDRSVYLCFLSHAHVGLHQCVFV